MQIIELISTMDIVQERYPPRIEDDNNIWFYHRVVHLSQRLLFNCNVIYLLMVKQTYPPPKKKPDPYLHDVVVGVFSVWSNP